jgi:hypothetical protein
MSRRSVVWCLALSAAAASAHANISGRVVTRNGDPIASATVTAYRPETTEARAKRHLAGQDRVGIAIAQSAKDGSFRLACEDAIVAVGVRANGFAPGIVLATPVDPVTLTLNEAVQRRGVVTVAKKPVTDAVVVWTTAGSDGVEWLVHTGQDGSYEAPDPSRWADEVVILHRDFAPRRRVINRHALLEDELAAGIGIAGRVVEEKTERAVSGATISVDGWPLAQSAADGTFAVAHAPSEWETLSAEAPVFVSAARRPKGPIVLVAHPARRLAGVVRDAVTRKPLAGAEVHVRDADGMAERTVWSAGEYSIGSLPPGRYWVWATRPGYEYTTLWGGGDAKPIDLRKETSSRYDLELRPLHRLSGRVQDEQSRPVGNALVQLVRYGTGVVYRKNDTARQTMMMDWGLGDGGPVSSVRTAADGRFTILLEDGALPPRQALPLVGLKDGYAAGISKITRATADTPVTITLPKGVSIAARVRTAQGAPLAGVGIAVREVDGVDTEDLRPSDAGELDSADWATSDDDGRFTLQLHPVLHRLSFHASGYATRAIDDFDPNRNASLDLVLEHAAEVRGRVLYADGGPVVGATIVAQDAAGQLVATTRSAADGGFALLQLAAGTYTLEVASSGSPLFARRSVRAPAADVRIQLSPTRRVRGYVTDAKTKAAISGASITLERPEPSGDGDDIALPEMSAATDEAGAFTLDLVPVGPCALTATADGYLPKKIEKLEIVGGTEPMALDLALEPGLSLTGHVSRTDGGAVEDATVALINSASSGATTDVEGAYELKGLAAGLLTVRVTHPDFQTAQRRFTARESTRLDFSLVPGLALEGIVVSHGAGVPDMHVRAKPRTSDDDTRSATSDATGHFILRGLAPGRYAITAGDEEHGAIALDVDAATSPPLRLELKRAPTSVLTGRIVGLHENVENRSVTVEVEVKADDGRSSTTMVEADRTFRFEDAPAGPVTIAAAVQGRDGSRRSSRSQEMTLEEGSETSTELQFTDLLMVSGTVTRGGNAVSGATVSFSKRDSSAAAKSDAAGHYQVSLAEPGTYGVTVEDPGSYEAEYAVTDGGGLFDIDITGSTLRGRVVNAATNVPVEAVDVSVWSLGGSQSSPAASAHTTAQGTFEMTSVREGRYRLVTAKKGFGQQVREVELARGGSADLLIALDAAHGVTLTVVDAADGRALDARVVVRDAAKRIVANQHAGMDEQGVLTIPLADGTYRLSTSANGYGTVTVPLQAPSDGLRLALTPGGTLVIESARKLSGRVRLLQPDGEEYVRCWCNGIADITLVGRRTSVDHVTAGSYTLEFMNVAPALPSRAITIEEGRTTTVDVDGTSAVR